jgi:hypothetical protein
MQLTQREIRHQRPLPIGKCGHSPRHYLDSRGAGSHLLECAMCGVSSGKMTTFNEALERWTGEAVRALRYVGSAK